MIPGLGNSDLLQKGEATTPIYLGLFVVQPVKNVLACGDLSTTPGFGRSPGEGKGCPLQYSCLPNSMDPIVYRVAKIWTRLKDLSLHFQEISPESRLDWSLPMPSGISSLKPTKNQKLAFAGSPLSPLHTHTHTHTQKPRMVPQAHRQAGGLTGRQLPSSLRWRFGTTVRASALKTWA